MYVFRSFAVAFLSDVMTENKHTKFCFVSVPFHLSELSGGKHVRYACCVIEWSGDRQRDTIDIFDHGMHACMNASLKNQLQYNIFSGCLRFKVCMLSNPQKEEKQRGKKVPREL